MYGGKLRTRKQCLYNSCFNFPFRKSLFYMQTSITYVTKTTIAFLGEKGMILNTYWETSCKTHSLILVSFRSWSSLLQLPPVLHVLSIMHPILFSKYAAFSIITPLHSFVSFFKALNACHQRELFLWFHNRLLYVTIINHNVNKLEFLFCS